MTSNALSVACSGVRNLAALDAAFSSRGMKEFYRGFGDARRYASVRRSGEDWLAEPANDSPCIIIGPVTTDYLDGLHCGGCTVIAERSEMQKAA